MQYINTSHRTKFRPRRPPVTEPFSARTATASATTNPQWAPISEIRTPNEHPQRPAQLIVLRQRPGHVAELGDCPKNHFANWEIAPKSFLRDFWRRTGACGTPGTGTMSTPIVSCSKSRLPSTNISRHGRCVMVAANLLFCTP